ncbi:MAG TPA: potassium channel protein [Chloroflexota bacterium]|nr:potassium channel protein [Chloroflexota bacterium]
MPKPGLHGPGLELVALRRPLLAVAAVLSVGVAGYMVIEGWSFFDALYMVVTTVTTVGYGEVHPLSLPGRAFTMLLIVLGVGTMLYTLSTIVHYAVAGELTRQMGRRRMESRIEQLRDHVVLCGYGRVGRQIAAEFRRERVPYVVVDVNEASLATAHNDGCLWVPGNAASDDVLLAAGVKRARALIAAVDSDVDNVYVTLSARGLNPRLFIVARASREDAESKLRRAGADRVISPYQIGGRRMAMLALRPVAVDFVDTIMHDPSTDLLLEELAVQPTSPLVGKRLAAARGGAAAGAIVLAVKRDGRLIPNPPGDFAVQAGDQLVVMGTPSDLRAIEGYA